MTWNSTSRPENYTSSNLGREDGEEWMILILEGSRTKGHFSRQHLGIATRLGMSLPQHLANSNRLEVGYASVSSEMEWWRFRIVCVCERSAEPAGQSCLALFINQRQMKGVWEHMYECMWKLYHRAIVTETNTQVNRTGEPRVSRCNYSHLICV